MRSSSHGRENRRPASSGPPLRIDRTGQRTAALLQLTAGRAGCRLRPRLCRHRQNHVAGCVRDVSGRDRHPLRSALPPAPSSHCPAPSWPRWRPPCPRRSRPWPSWPKQWRARWKNDRGVIDDVDTWRLAATWLRTELIPAMPANVRFVLAGSASSATGLWASEYGTHFLDIRLRPSTARRATPSSLLPVLPPEIAERIWRLTAGHPLGLRMAIHSARTEVSIRPVMPANSPMPFCTRSGTASCAGRWKPAPLFAGQAFPWSPPFWNRPSPFRLSLLEGVEALPFATRDAEGFTRRAGSHRRSSTGCPALMPSAIRRGGTIAADWFVARFASWGGHAVGGIWRTCWICSTSLRFAMHSFPLDTAAPPVEPAQERISNKSSRSPRQATVPTSGSGSKRGPSDCRTGFRWHGGRATKCWPSIVFARDDDPISGLGTLDPVFADVRARIWQKTQSPERFCSLGKYQREKVTPNRGRSASPASSI